MAYIFLDESEDFGFDFKKGKTSKNSIEIKSPLEEKISVDIQKIPRKYPEDLTISQIKILNLLRE